jgi:hypothetical protein
VREKKELRRIAVALEQSQHAPTVRDTAHEPRLPKQIRKVNRPLMYRFRVWAFSSPSKSRRATLARMSFPIMGLVGPNGGGKTAAAVAMANVAMNEQHRRVLSTVPLIDSRKGSPTLGQPHPLYVPWRHWDQLLDWWDGDVLADEVLSIAGSRASASLDPRAQTLLVQLRKRNARFWWTAPSFARADVIIREVTQAITECRGFYAARGLAQERRGVIQSWAPKRLFSFRTYDATEFDEWTTGRREKADPMITDWFHGPGSAVFASYDTLGAVDVIAGMNEAGVCDTCNGMVSGKPRACRCREPKVRPSLPVGGDSEHGALPAVVFAQATPDGPPDHGVGDPQSQRHHSGAEDHVHDYGDDPPGDDSPDVHSGNVQPAIAGWESPERVRVRT